MGWDQACEVIGRCSCEQFVQYYRDLYAAQYADKRAALDAAMAHFRPMANEDIIWFFDSIELSADVDDLDVDKCDLSMGPGTEAGAEPGAVDGWDSVADRNCDLLPWVCMELLLEQQHVAGDTRIGDYMSSLFNDDHRIKVDDDHVDIHITSWSSYKGSEDITVDYRAVVRDIERWESNIAGIEILTRFATW